MNPRNMSAACSLVSADRSRPRKTPSTSVRSQTVSAIRTRCSPRPPGPLPWPSAASANAAVSTSLGTTGSRMAAANSRSLVP